MPVRPALLLLCLPARLAAAANPTEKLHITLHAPELAQSEDASEFPVVEKGLTKTNWAVAHGTAKPEVTLSNMPENNFRLTVESGEIPFERPILAVGNHSVMSPILTGPLRRGGHVKQAPQTLTIKYNCVTPGTSSLKVSLPFPHGKDDKEPVIVEYMWTVDCESNPKEGFTIKTSDGTFVAENGLADDDWAVLPMAVSGGYVPAAVPADLYSVDSKTNKTRFILSILSPARSKSKKVTQQAFTRPRIHVTPANVASPSFSGNGRRGGTVFAAKKADGKGVTKRLDVLYNCFAEGTVTVTVVIPFPSDNFKKIIFTWKKTCGGGAVKDLKIVTADDEPVVSKGDVMPAWVPVSGDYAVDAVETSTTFRLTKGKEGSTRFKPPTIEAKPSDVCNPSLDGSGRKGASVRGPNKDPVDLIVVYNCVAQGTAVITLTIELAMNAPLVISWTKTCGGIPRPYFSVTTWENAVVKDGVTYDDWSSEYVGEAFAAVVDSSDDKTSLYLGLEARDETTTAFYEPEWSDWADDIETPTIPANLMSQTYQRPRVETSDKSICNPTLGNVASKGGTITSYGDDQQLDVSYHCLRPGSAVVTVTIPVGVYADVTFSWTKVCKKKFVRGLSVGTGPGADDVVTEGHAQVYFDTSQEAEGRRMVVDKHTLFSTFHVTLDRGTKPMGFGEPYVSANPPICSPRVSGEMRKGGQLTANEAMKMKVNYNCAVGGSTVITLRIPLEDDTKEAVTWAWRKNNGPAPAVKSAIERQSHYDTSEVLSLLVLVVGLLAAAYCISGKMGKNESHDGYSRVAQKDSWGRDSSKKH